MKTADISVNCIQHMGDDLTVVNAARVSMDKWHPVFDPDKDAGLIHYLAEHNHWSPFAHCFLQFRIKAPIFVARQLFKHQIGLVINEVSRRYIDSEPEFYIPEMRARAENVKQGSKNELIEGHEKMTEELEICCKSCLAAYQDMLDNGVAPEVARSVLPQNMMTQWIWSGSLYAFARVCNLRLDQHAQKESQIVAQMIWKYLSELFPVSTYALVRAEHV